MSKKHLLWLVGQLLCLCLEAQPAGNPIAPETYEIGGIRVSGNENSEPAALLTVAGLRIGDRIRMPGPETTKALKNLIRLGLFSDVQIIREKSIGDIAFLEIAVKEQSRLSGHGFRGVPKSSMRDDLNTALAGILIPGTILSDNKQAEALDAIQKHYLEKGFANASIVVLKEPGKAENTLRVVFEINQGKKVKVQDIAISGNAQVKTGKLLKLLPTKAKRKFW